MARNSNEGSSADTREPKAPALIAYAVTGKGEGENKKSYWTRIGAAWKHEDGEGLTLQLDLVPVNGGRIVLRTPKDDANEIKEKGA
jgi:hypothetical protein